MGIERWSEGMAKLLVAVMVGLILAYKIRGG